LVNIVILIPEYTYLLSYHSLQILSVISIYVSKKVNVSIDKLF